MTPADAVLSDALRKAGFERLTTWRLRAVEAYLRAIVDPEVHPWNWDKVAERLTRDLKERTIDGIHLLALWDDAERDGDHERVETAVRQWSKEARP